MISFLWLVFAFLPSDAQATASHYGTRPDLRNPVTLKKLYENSHTDGKTYLVKGTIEKVCKEKGCWLTLRDKHHSIRVVFKNYSFFVPTNILNSFVHVQGVAKHRNMSITEQQHYLKDAGASPEKIEKVIKSKKILQFEASGLALIHRE